MDNRVACQNNLGAIGRALVMYQGEYRDRLPKSWGESADTQCFGGGTTSRIDFNEPGEFGVKYFMNSSFYGSEEQVGPNGRQNAGMCLWLLVRHEGIDPKSFLCPSVANDQEMMLEDIARESRANGYLVEFWRDMVNFQSMRNLSYSYHDPWNKFGLQEDSALAADKSNAFDTANGLANAAALGADNMPHRNPDGSWSGYDGSNLQHGNSRNHQTECQNVLFMNTSVKRTETPLIGVGGDNIYTRWPGPGPKYTVEQKQIFGKWGNLIDFPHARGRSDSYLGN
jgi:hypothetical protein